MRVSIRYQLLVPLLTLLLGVVGVSTWTAVVSAQRAVEQQIESHVRGAAQVLNRSNVPLIDEAFKYVKDLSGLHYYVKFRDARPPLKTLDADPGPLLAAVPVSSDLQAFQLGPPVEVGGEVFLCSGVKLDRPEVEALYIFYSESRWRDARWEAIRLALLLGGVFSVLSIALAVFLAQRLSRRVRDLEQRTRQIAAGDFSPMPLPGWNDELRDLGGSINEMAQRLAKLQEAVQRAERLRLLGQVGGGLAHQLRNGVAGARLAVQLHARDCNGEADAEALEVALRQLTLLEEKLRRFLDLGRTDSPLREPCALTTLVDEAVGLVHPQCRHANIELVWQPPETPCTVVGDSNQLGHLFINLITNAVEAAGPGGRVEVRAFHETALQSGPVIVEVIDSGPGPPPETAERLFEPFVTSKRDGVGLGLAVARQVAETHGGRVSWRRDNDRTVFRVELAAP